MRLIKASDGRTNLFIWREGEEYYRQKSPIFLKEFTTLKYDVAPQPPDSSMIYVDVTKPLRFDDGSFDNIYCYHVYEHLTHKEADFFTAQIHRVLKPGGMYRLSSPDMEMCAGEYLKYLEGSLVEPNDLNLKRYRWAVMKLIEQSLRETTGGLMLEEIRKGAFDVDYVREKYGESYAAFFVEEPKKETVTTMPPRRSLLKRLLSLSPEKIMKRIEYANYQRLLKEYRNGIGADMRKNRETVTLLPDRLYFQLILEKQGFVDFKVKDYKTSDIPNWNKYDLDRSNNGDYAYDPSVYAEARKKKN